MVEIMRIERKKIFLTRITYDDTEDIVRWRNTDFVQKNFIYREPFTTEGHKKWMKNMIETGQAVQFIIWEQSTSKKIGSVYLRDIDHKNKKAEFGIFIGEKECCGKGYGREAAEIITEYAFSVLCLNKVFLRVLSYNERAYRSYLRAGFKQEGFFKADVYVDDKPLDVIFMAKFSEICGEEMDE